MHGMMSPSVAICIFSYMASALLWYRHVKQCKSYISNTLHFQHHHIIATALAQELTTRTT